MFEKHETVEQLLRALAEASKKPLDDMDKHHCWPPGEFPAQDHVPYYWLRTLIAEVDKWEGRRKAEADSINSPQAPYRIDATSPQA